MIYHAYFSLAGYSKVIIKNDKRNQQNKQDKDKQSSEQEDEQRQDRTYHIAQKTEECFLDKDCKIYLKTKEKDHLCQSRQDREIWPAQDDNSCSREDTEQRRFDKKTHPFLIECFRAGKNKDKNIGLSLHGFERIAAEKSRSQRYKINNLDDNP